MLRHVRNCGPRQTKCRQSARRHGFLVNAPRAEKLRVPLAITLSRDGRHFDRAWALRGEVSLQPLRFEGRYKRPGFQYPKSVIWKDHLYVGYATNKEDVELTRVPLSSF